jgi:hypothetical protein
MTVVVHHRPRSEVALHEAGHTAATIMLRGRLPLRVTADRPGVDLAGVTQLDLSNDGLDERPREFMMLTLSALLVESIPVPDWPIEPTNGHTSGDERALAVLVDHLGLTEDDWLGIVDRTRRLIESRDFQRLTSLIGRALELANELTADDLRQLIPRRLRLKYLEEPWST